MSRVNLISVKNPFRIVKSLKKDGEPNKREDYKIGKGSSNYLMSLDTG